MAGKRKQKVTPRALLEIKMPGDVQIAPDSFRIAYSVQEIDWDDNRVVQHLHVTTVAEDSTPRQVTRGQDSETAPRWSPDGKWLAFLSTRGGEDESDDDFDDEDPKQQIWLLPMDGGGGEAEKLSDVPEGVGDFDWLPDSSGVVYLAREPRRKPLKAAHDDRQDRKNDAVVEREEKFRQQIWRISVDDKKAKLVHPGDFGIGEIAMSPKGNSVAYVTNYTGEVNDYHRSDVWAVDMDSSETRQLTNSAGGKYHPAWTRDGAAVLFVRALNPELSFSQLNLFSISAEGGEIVNLTLDFPHDLSGWHPFWQDDAGALYVSAALGTTTAIFRCENGAFQSLIENDEHIHEFHVASNGGVSLIAGSLGEAPEVFWLAPGASESEALTDLNQDWHDKYALASAEPVAWQSADGLEIEGLLTYPSGYDPDQTYPLVLALHGGPYGRSVQDLSPYSTAQVYAAEGYAVLEPNYRGSEGYGDAFSTAIQKDLGGGDYSDVIAGVDWLIAEGVADPERLAVSGSSYGGYLVNWIISQTPRFKAAISKFGIFSLVTDFSNSQAPRWELEYLAAFPWDNPQLYAERSPASYVKNIQTPVLILHGESDPNTFIANSQEMYTALHLLGKPVQYVHYPREGHGFSEPEHR
ncbi:MAG: S9 family peptidase, partial [Armatimonadota bacterium]|nr:S9 family peptidase [Armatimonadota bacterium]